MPTTASASPHYLGKVITFARECGELSGEILAHISSADTARDLDYLRDLAGDTQLTYLGESYGSFLGQTYANMFPNRVRAMVLDGVVDPIAYITGNEVGLSKNVASTDLVFSKFEALCQAAGPSRCALAGKGSVATRVTQLLATLQHASTQARPEKRRLTYADALIAIYTRIGSPAAWPELAELLNKAANGDGSAVLGRAAIWYKALPAALPPAIAIGCADSPAQQSTQAWPNAINRLTRVSRFYGPLLGWWLWAPCAAWPAHSIYRYAGPWNVSRSPILVIGTMFDPNTPMQNARRVARLLGNAVLLTQQGSATSASQTRARASGALPRSFLSTSYGRRTEAFAHRTVFHLIRTSANRLMRVRVCGWPVRRFTRARQGGRATLFSVEPKPRNRDVSQLLTLVLSALKVLCNTSEVADDDSLEFP